MQALLVLGCPDGTGAHRMAHRIAVALLRAGHGVGFLTNFDDLESERDAARASEWIDELEALGTQVFLRRVTVPSIVAATRSLGVGERSLVAFQQRDRKNVALASLTGTARAAVHVGNPHRFWGPPAVRPVKRAVYGTMMRHGIHRFIATSSSVSRDLQRLGIDPARIDVVPNGIPLPDISEGGGPDGPLRRELDLSSSTRLIMSVGRIDPQKGQDTLLSALTHLGEGADWHYALVGSASAGNQAAEQQTFLRRVEELRRREKIRDRVTFLGFREDVPSLLPEADVFVHPSRWEGPDLCLAVMEAMAAERYCILAQTGDRPEGFVQRRHGVLVPPEAPELLAKELQKAIIMRAEARAEVGRRARALIEERYSNERLLPRIVDILDEMTGGTSRC